MGEQIPAFIQDELRSRAPQLGVDMAEIDQLYPIVSAEQAKSVWRINQESKQGIGSYHAVSGLTASGKFIPVAGTPGHRF